MQLSIGSKVGPYEIVARLGAGGMGEVWKAHDSRLDRLVAIKVLPAEMAENARLKLRFEREARLISQLDHPNISHLYDVGPDYLVMEFVDGQPLSKRLANHPLPVEDALRYGAEVADALEQAHRAGIVHRDVKPANIMITKSGAKLLDFGIAKADDQQSLNEAVTLTREGTVVGTVHYMSPEQIEGMAVDARSDIFSLGVVLYEMVTGRKPFDANSANGVLGAILKDHPRPLRQLQPMVSPGLEHAIEKCIAKAPGERWQSAADLAAELRWLAAPLTSAETAGAPGRDRPRGSLTWAGITIAVAALITAAMLSLRREPTRTEEPIRFSVAVPGTERVPFTFGLVAVSPDGRTIVFASSNGGELQLFSRRLDSEEAVPIRGTTGATHPFFSPDGRWIGFFANHQLRKVLAEGGDPVPIAKATTQPCGGSWADDGTIVYCTSRSSSIVRVSATAGPAQKAVLVAPAVSAADAVDRAPYVLPGSKAFLYAIRSPDGTSIVAQRFGSGERRVVASGRFPFFVAPDRLVYQLRNVLYSIQMDPETLVTKGEPVPLLEDVAAREFSVNTSGSLVAYVPTGGTTTDGGTVELLGRSGQPLPLPDAALAKIVRSAVWSPDNRKFACRSEGNVWVFDTQTAIWRRLGVGILPAWTADGKRVMYGRDADGPTWWQAADGGDSERLVFPHSPVEAYWPHAVSPDGIHVLVGTHQPGTSYDLYLGDIRMGELRPFAATEWDDHVAAFSPDGKWVAYSTDETGRFEVYVRPLEGSGRWQVSTDGGDWPVWKTPDEIVYRVGTKIMSVAVHTRPEFSSERPKLLFEHPLDSFDLTSDGQRFLVVKSGGKAPEKVSVIANWRRELDRKSAR